MLMSTTAALEKRAVGFECPGYATMGNKEDVHIMTDNMKSTGIAAQMGGPEKLAELVRRGREGDMEALETIFIHFRLPLFNLALRYTYNAAVAEDLLQDVFLKVFTHIRDLDKDGAFIGWIYRITITTCLTYLRSHKHLKHKSVALDDVENKLSGGEPRGEKMLAQSIENALRPLPPRLKSVFLLHDVQGFKHREIAEILGCSEGTCKSQLFKARVKIRKHLKSRRVL